MSQTSPHSIANLRIYQLALASEGQCFQLANQLPPAQTFELGNRLRRSSSAVAHYIYESHGYYSYQLKIRALQDAARAGEDALRFLREYAEQGFGDTTALAADYANLIRQTWGLIKFFRQKQLDKQSDQQTRNSDELVATKPVPTAKK